MKNQDEPIIEKNVPVPRTMRSSKSLDLFRKMEVGDSVVLSKRKDVNNVKALIRSRGFRAVERKLQDGAGWRVWMLNLHTPLSEGGESQYY